jgi:hypothetical protein
MSPSSKKILSETNNTSKFYITPKGYIKSKTHILYSYILGQFLCRDIVEQADGLHHFK